METQKKFSRFIRGIDVKLYKRLKLYALKNDLTIGEAINKMLEETLR